MEQLTRHAMLALLALMLVGVLPAQPAAAQRAAYDEPNSDVVLVIDHSGSMEENDPTFLRLAAAKLFIDLADPGDKIGIVVMSGNGQTRKLTRRLMRIDQRDSVQELKALIDGLRNEPMGDETHMGTALSLAHELLDTTSGGTVKANQRQFVVLLTDGRPTGDGQSDKVDQAVRKFQERRYWKIFSIALGADAAPDYLQNAIAAPLGAAVVIANTASELINSYLTVYARAGDDRFVDTLEVQPNALEPLVQISADQQPTHLSVVLVRDGTDARISHLNGPDQRDIVQPYYQNTIQRGDEPEYELYSVPPSAQVDFVGNWNINVAQSTPDPVKIVVLSRSRLRLRLPVPAPLSLDDDSSVRYHPIGRPLFLVAGAEVAIRNRDMNERVHAPYTYDWVTGLNPVVYEGDAPTPQAVLTDDGHRYDTKANDGQYSGLYPGFAEPGDYTLRIEMPYAAEEPIHVDKTYVIRAASLPTMTLTLPPAATTLPIHTGFNGLIDIPARADFQIKNVDFPVAFVERPDGEIESVAVQPIHDTRFQFHYTPDFVGAYRISIAAEVSGTGPMGDIHYVDYTEAAFATPDVVPTILVSSGVTQTLTYNRDGVVEIPVIAASDSAKPEVLKIDVEGVPNTVTVPAEILLDPHERVQRTIAVHLPPAERPKQGELSLVLYAPAQQTMVQDGRITAEFRARTNLLLPLLLALLALCGVGFMVFRRYRRRRTMQLALASSGPRR